MRNPTTLSITSFLKDTSYFYRMERFTLQVKLDGRVRSLPVQAERDANFETYRVMGNKNTLVLRCNMPMLRARGLKTKRANWKLLEGLIPNIDALGTIQEALEARSRAQYEGKGKA